MTLHTGVSSLENDAPPYPERFEVPAVTAATINATRDRGGRVFAVGTTVVRALESAATDARARAARAWTDLVVTPRRGVRLVDGLLTGLHAPRSSHLSMLACFLDPTRLIQAYRQALDRQYLWHEFGDTHLLMPPG